MKYIKCDKCGNNVVIEDDIINKLKLDYDEKIQILKESGHPTSSEDLIDIFSLMKEDLEDL